MYEASARARIESGKVDVQEPFNGIWNTEQTAMVTNRPTARSKRALD